MKILLLIDKLKQPEYSIIYDELKASPYRSTRQGNLSQQPYHSMIDVWQKITISSDMWIFEGRD